MAIESVADVTKGNQEGKTSTGDKDMDILNTLDEKPTNEKDEKIEDKEEEDKEEVDEGEKEKEEEVDEEYKEEKEDEEVKDKEEETEDEELDENDSLYQQIKTADKDIFKKVKGLRSVIFREQEFTKMFPSIEEAKEAQGALETFTGFQKDIEDGQAETLLSSVKELGEGKLLNFAGDFMPSLFKLDKDAYYKIMAPEIKKLLRAAAKSGNEQLKISAKNLNYFIFEDTDVDKDEGFIKDKKDPERDKLSKEREEFEQAKYTDFRQDTAVAGASRLRKYIDNSIKDLDMSPLTHKHIVEEIFERATKSLEKDVRHMGNMKILWKKATQDRYSTSAKESIINAFLSRGKAAVMKYRQQVLSEARVSAKKASEEGEGEKRSATRIPSGGAPGRSSQTLGKIDPSKVDWSKTNERDLLDGKAPVMKR